MEIFVMEFSINNCETILRDIVLEKEQVIFCEEGSMRKLVGILKKFWKMFIVWLFFSIENFWEISKKFFGKIQYKLWGNTDVWSFGEILSNIFWDVLANYMRKWWDFEQILGKSEWF